MKNVNSAAEQAFPRAGSKTESLYRTPVPEMYRVSDVINAYNSAIGSRSRGGGKDSANRK